jgi:hypothetical protein
MGARRPTGNLSRRAKAASPLHSSLKGEANAGRYRRRGCSASPLTIAVRDWRLGDRARVGPDRCHGAGFGQNVRYHQLAHKQPSCAGAIARRFETPLLKCTQYFLFTRERPDRTAIKEEWIAGFRKE